VCRGEFRWLDYLRNIRLLTTISRNMNFKYKITYNKLIKNVYDTSYFFNKGYTNLNSFENNELDGDHAVRQNPGNSGLQFLQDLSLH